MEADDLLAESVSVRSVGGQDTLYKPPVFSCADLTHEPFRLLGELARLDGDDQVLLWGGC